MNYELDLEYDLSFHIYKYINMIKQEDILVSDMYLSNTRNLRNKYFFYKKNIYIYNEW